MATDLVLDVPAEEDERGRRPLGHLLGHLPRYVHARLQQRVATTLVMPRKDPRCLLAVLTGCCVHTHLYTLPSARTPRLSVLS